MKNSLGIRMKENYEKRFSQKLVKRTNTLIRLDGVCWHTYTKGLDKPFDQGLIEDMQETTRYLCKNIQGVKCGYTQSDEISLLLTDYDNLQTDAYFDGNIQKITSVSASMATAKFNELRFARFVKEKAIIGTQAQYDLFLDNFYDEYIYEFKNVPSLAFFDSRVFQIPEKEEVVNYFLWRQRDAERNSVSMLAQSLYSHKELFKKNSSQMQEMCFQKGYNWNDLEYYKKRGSFVIKQNYINGINKNSKDDRGNNIIEYFSDTNKYSLFDEEIGDNGEWVDILNPTIRSEWELVETPIFSKNRESILNLLP